MNSRFPTSGASSGVRGDPGARVLRLTAVAARQPNVHAAVQANHDDNTWWPTYVRDWRIRMTVAGWSARVSWNMIGTYAGVVRQADMHGWGGLTAMTDRELNDLARPLGLARSRVRYLRSLESLVANRGHADLLDASPDTVISQIAARSRARHGRSPSAPCCTPGATTAE